MKPSLDDLSLFIAVAEERSFTAAAVRLGLPKSTVSRRLVDLEVLLRVSLLRRTTRALSLTDDGRRIYEMAGPAIAAANHAASTIADRDRTVAGRVTLTTTAALAQYLVAPRLVGLTETYPEVQVDLRLSEERINIVGEGVDIAVRMGQLDDSSLIARRLCAVRRMLVASPAYLAKAGTPQTPADLSDHNAIVTSPALDTWRFDGTCNCEVRWTIAAGNMLVAHQLCRLDQGIALLPDFLLDEDIARGALVPLLENYTLEQADAWIVTSQQRHRSPAIQAVLTRLTASEL